MCVELTRSFDSSGYFITNNASSAFGIDSGHAWSGNAWSRRRRNVILCMVICIPQHLDF